jgi:Protein of unknown function (DUF3710)
VFRRRSREDAVQPGLEHAAAQDDLAVVGRQDFLAGLPDDSDDFPAALADDSSLADGSGPDGAADAAANTGRHGSGPWDAAGRYPAAERMDFGSLQIPVREGFEVQVNMAEDQGVWIAVLHGENGLQLQAFAAPKTISLWDEVRQEIAAEVAKTGGDCEEVKGPFGFELHARVQTGENVPGRAQHEPVRFLGVDGPRWFLRGVISGPAARRPELARQFEEVFADVVVVRGEYPAPPRDLLEIKLPEEAQAALDEQLAAEDGEQPPNPFERGPEITETR